MRNRRGKRCSERAKRRNKRCGGWAFCCWRMRGGPIRRLQTRSARRAIWCRSGANALPCMSHHRRWRRTKSIPSRVWGPRRTCPRQVPRRLLPPLARHTGVAVACQGGEEREYGGFSHYSVRDLARLVAGRGEILTMSPATVQRILAELVLKPHRLRYFLTRTDPQFEEKMAAILDLYLSPPRRCRILCLDEKTHI